MLGSLHTTKFHALRSNLWLKENSPRSRRVRCMGTAGGTPPPSLPSTTPAALRPLRRRATARKTPTTRSPHPPLRSLRRRPSRYSSGLWRTTTARGRGTAYRPVSLIPPFFSLLFSNVEGRTKAPLYKKNSSRKQKNTLAYLFSRDSGALEMSRYFCGKSASLYHEDHFVGKFRTSKVAFSFLQSFSLSSLSLSLSLSLSQFSPLTTNTPNRNPKPLNNSVPGALEARGESSGSARRGRRERSRAGEGRGRDGGGSDGKQRRRGFPSLCDARLFS